MTRVECVQFIAATFNNIASDDLVPGRTYMYPNQLVQREFFNRIRKSWIEANGRPKKILDRVKETPRTYYSSPTSAF